jgi:hypothetical protein
MSSTESWAISGRESISVVSLNERYGVTPDTVVVTRRVAGELRVLFLQNFDLELFLTRNISKEKLSTNCRSNLFFRE